MVIVVASGEQRGFLESVHPICLRAAHAVAAVEATIAGTAADGQRPAVVAGGGIALEVSELAVLLAQPVDGDWVGHRRLDDGCGS